jgi:hypothetical protein
MLEYDSLRFRSSPSVDAAAARWPRLKGLRVGKPYGEAYSGTSKKPLSHSDFLNCQEDGASVGLEPTTYGLQISFAALTLSEGFHKSAIHKAFLLMRCTMRAAVWLILSTN